MVFARRLRPKTSALLLFVALILLLPRLSPVVLAQEGFSAQSLIQQAFREVNQAEGAGGNVSSLVSSLNVAVALSSEADRLQNSNPGRAAQLSSQAEAIDSGHRGGANGSRSGDCEQAGRNGGLRC